MPYPTVADLKKFLNTTSISDSQLQVFLDAAIKTVEDLTQKRFYVPSEEVRTYRGTDVIRSTNELFISDYLAAVPSSVKVNGTNLVAWTDYLLLPTSQPPYVGLKFTSYLAFLPSDTIEITGKFGYTEDVPPDIFLAIIDTAIHLSRIPDKERETLISPSGVIVKPEGIPATVWMVLQPYMTPL